ncbi:MAG: glycosyltransferase family 2 protein [Ignavibacteria bacterium]|nr:glycosyltransferase family 2 protein [Ignavibacteria bacterium]
MKYLPQNVQKYLDKYGLTKWKIEPGGTKLFDNIIVIPAIAEFENLKNLLSPLFDNDIKHFTTTLVLIVVNNTSSASEEVRINNKKSIELIRQFAEKDFSISKNNNLTIRYVDAYSVGNEMPEKKGGVGFARKLGMDLALTMFNYSSSNKKLLICLDADCVVEKNYLSTIVEEFNMNNYSAAYINYEHLLPENEKEKLAIICYEIFLRYYLCGLKYSKSPFAFPTIGSTIVCDYESYIKVGGMNKRKAGEDFYFLEKLAKITTIHSINNTTVYPSSRDSWRVPFGTGQRVKRFLEKEQNEYVLYNPESFIVLKRWNDIFYHESTTINKLINDAESINPALKDFLELNSFNKQWEKIVRSAKSKEQITKQKSIWFDGFKTLKLIHYLRDNAFPQINMFNALDRFFELINIDKKIIRDEDIPSLETQQLYLEILKSIADNST